MGLDFWLIYRNSFLYDWECYISNRFVYKNHYLRTGLTPGKYHENDERVFHALKNIIVDYVEIECAAIQRSIPSKYGKYERTSKWYQPWRSRAAGIQYIVDRMTETEFRDASDFYSKIFDLYEGLTTRRQYSSIFVEDAWKQVGTLLKSLIEEYGSIDSLPYKQKLNYHRLLRNASKLEDKQKRADKKMMKQVIDLLPSLWT
jgi:hypothetical protein